MKSPVARELAPWQPERRQLLSDLFHGLNQPLTTLGCSLELALLKPQSAEQCQETIRQAGVQVEKVAQLTGHVRRMVEADDPGDPDQAVDLGRVAREVVEELSPVAESLQVRLSLCGDVDCTVWIEEIRLRQALFGLLDLVLDASREEVLLELSSKDRVAALAITSSLKDVSEEMDSHPDRLRRQVGLAVAYRVFESCGGRITIFQENSQLRLGIELPVTGIGA